MDFTGFYKRQREPEEGKANTLESTWKKASFQRKIASQVGVLMLVFLVWLLVQLSVIPLSITSILYLLCFGLLTIGALTAPWRRKRLRYLCRIALTLLLAIMISRIVLISEPKEMHLQSRSDWLGRLIDEQDLLLLSVRASGTMNTLTARERDGLIEALTELAQGQQEDLGSPPSPLLRSLLSNSPQEISFSPFSDSSSQIEVVFIHGFAAATTLACWQISQVAREYSGNTHCPSIGWEGHWGDHPEAMAKVIDTLPDNKQLLIIAHSNAGPALIDNLDRLPQGSHLAFISALDESKFYQLERWHKDKAGQGKVLVIQGLDDERFPVFEAPLAFIPMGNKEKKPEFLFFEIPGDHLLFYKEAKTVSTLLKLWIDLTLI